MVSEARPAITFQVYRANLKAKTLEEFQGQQLTEFGIYRQMVSGADTVAMAKETIRPLLQGNLTESDYITFFFSGKPMRDDALFYATHYMSLPVWVQIVLHDCELEEVEESIRRFQAPADP